MAETLGPLGNTAKSYEEIQKTFGDPDYDARVEADKAEREHFIKTQEARFSEDPDKKYEPEVNPGQIYSGTTSEELLRNPDVYDSKGRMKGVYYDDIVEADLQHKRDMVEQKPEEKSNVLELGPAIKENLDALKQHYSESSEPSEPSEPSESQQKREEEKNQPSPKPSPFENL